MFSKILKDLRTEFNMSQSELAKKLDISPSTVGMYEQGRRYPDFDTLIKISEFFNVSLDFLLGKTLIRNEQNTSLNLTKKQLKALELASQYSDEEFETIIKLINTIKKGT
ncbi:hypothetical protein TPELB_23890 [Terrisporobacter petrolearius]|uniref:HTH cro/C1-type domain-containing protein n=1 Tax=Terrisporobacter petrolearius TaxID=1460447 RepID=A0ABZ3FFT5_9FIRM